MISKLTLNICSAKSPSPSPIDLWFWGVADKKVRSVQPKYLNELKQLVDGLADLMEHEESNRTAKCFLDRSKVSLLKGGGTFEYCYHEEKKNV